MCLTLLAGMALCGFQPAPDWPIADQMEARAVAAHVIVARIDSARQPRGSWGMCPADGHVIAAERGTMKFGDAVAAFVPCQMFAEGTRWIPMWAMHDGTWARIWFDARGRTLDYEPLQFAPAKGPEPRR